MLLSVHVTSVLFLVWVDNFALTTDFYWSYTLLLKLLVHMHSWTTHSLVLRSSLSPILITSSIRREHKNGRLEKEHVTT